MEFNISFLAVAGWARGEPCCAEEPVILRLRQGPGELLGPRNWLG